MSKSSSKKSPSRGRRGQWKPAAYALGVSVVVGIIYWQFGWRGGQSAVDSIRVPELSAVAALGQKAFDETCARCHGPRGSGTDQGPPLIHDIYNPGHHGDAAFYNAAKRGAKQHHWRFGNMPAQPQVSDSQITAIIRYVRELQQANGIATRAHRMP